jgi:hypothetical protein
MKGLQDADKRPGIEMTCNAVQDDNDSHKTIHRGPIYGQLPSLSFSSGLDVQSFFVQIFL